MENKGIVGKKMNFKKRVNWKTRTVEIKRMKK